MSYLNQAVTQGSAKPKRSVLILGGTGFLGTNLARRLSEAGHRVLITGRQAVAKDGRTAINVHLDNTAAISDIIRLEKVEVVVHMVSTMLPSSTMIQFDREISDVEAPTIRLAHLLAKSGVKMVFMSSGGTVYGAVECDKIVEETPCRPISPYGQFKLNMERRLLRLARHDGLALLVLRPSNPYGVYQSPKHAQGLISVILGRVMSGEALEIWGDGSIVRDYIHVDDAMYMISGLIEQEVDGIFNIGSGVGTSILEVVRCVEEVTKCLVPLRFRPTRSVDVPRVVLNVDRLQRIGLYNARSLADGMRYYVEQLGIIDGR